MSLNTLRKSVSSLAVLLLVGNLSVFAQTALGQAPTGPGSPSVGGAETRSQAGRERDLITVDFADADIQTVFKVLALKAGVNIVVGPEVTGTVTIQLKDVPWSSAFDTIVRTYGYTYEKDGNIYQVFSPDTLQKMAQQDVRSEVFSLEYAKLDQVLTALKKVISPQGTIESIPTKNQIVITDTATNLRRAKGLISEIDRREPQVLVDAKIVRTTLQKGENLGIDWNTVISVSGAKRPTTFPFRSDNPGDEERSFERAMFENHLFPSGQTAQLNTTTTTGTGATATSQTIDFPQANGFPFVKPEQFKFGTIDFSEFSAVLKLLKSRKSTKLISNPRIVVLNHQPAVVQVGGITGVPKFERNKSTGAFEVTGFDEKTDGIVLNVTPHVTGEREILVDIKPEVKSPVTFTPLGKDLPSPSQQTISAATNVLIQSGDTVVIGGLITNGESDSRKKVPFLGEVPVLGWLFKSMARDPLSNTKEETIFFVTVTTVDETTNKKALVDWRKQQQEYRSFVKYSEEEFLRKRGKKNKK